MPRVASIQNNFTSGVLSPLLKGRSDLEQYYNSLEVGNNIVTIPQGGCKRRPGLKYIDTLMGQLSRNTTTPTMPEGGAAANINDGDDTTSATTINNISTTDPYVVAHYDLGTAKTIAVADVRGATLSANSSTEFDVQYSDDNSTWTTAFSHRTIDSTLRDVRQYVGVSARYWRFARIGSSDLGTAKLTLDEFNLYEESGTSDSHLEGFEISADKNYLCLFTDLNVAIYLDGVRVADVKMPYTSDEVKALRVTQSERVMVIVHPNHPPRRLINQNADDNWTTDELPVSNIPQYDYNDEDSPAPSDEVQDITFNSFTNSQQYQLDIDGVLSKSITYDAGNTSKTAFTMQKNILDMPVVGETGVSVSYTSGSTYRVTFSGESTKDFELISGFPVTGSGSANITVAGVSNGSPRKEDVWSETRGYPAAVTYYQGRLIFGGVPDKPASIFFSKSGSGLDFEIGEGFDDEGIFVTLDTRKLNTVKDFFPGRDLVAFTTGSEFVTRDSPLTPTNITFKPQTSHGLYDVAPQEIDGGVFYIDKNGKTLRELRYNFNEDAYVADDISVLSQELINQPLDMAILKGTASDDANWLSIVNSDGNVTVLNTLKAQDINGFSSWQTQGDFQTVGVTFDQKYFVVQRTVDGSTVNYLEQWDFDFQLDSAVTKTPGSATVTGLDHLEGLEVRIVADGAVMANTTVSGGSITLERSADSVQVGLDYTPEIKPMPIAPNFGAGSREMRRKKIVRYNLRVKDALGIVVNGEPLPERNFSSDANSPLDTTPSLRTGLYSDIIDGQGWGRERSITITQEDPFPMTLLSIESEVETS